MLTQKQEQKQMHINCGMEQKAGSE